MGGFSREWDTVKPDMDNFRSAQSMLVLKFQGLGKLLDLNICCFVVNKFLLLLQFCSFLVQFCKLSYNFLLGQMG